MKIRKLIITFTLITLAVFSFASTASAEPSPQGALRAAFNTTLNGFDTIVWKVPNDVAAQHAAPAIGRFNYLINLFNEGQEFCDDTILGTWVTWIFWEEGNDREYIEASYNEIILDGQPLELERTPIKRAWPTFHVDDLEFWGYAQGVPVLGTLEPGIHTLSWIGHLVDDTQTSDITFEILSCSD